MALAKKKSKLNTSFPKAKEWAGAQFVICLKNDDYPASLEVHKVYRILFDPSAMGRRLARIVDESGEDYLYPIDYFVPITVPRSVEATFDMAV